MNRLKCLFSKTKFIVIPVVILLWLYLGWNLIGNFIYSILGYPIWLFVSLIMITWIIVKSQPENRKKGYFLVGVILSLVLTPVFWNTSLDFYRGYEYNRTVRALDDFIQEVVETGAVPQGYKVKEYRSEDAFEHFVDDATKEYDLYLDYFFGAFDISVTFANGKVYSLQIYKDLFIWEVIIYGTH